MSAEEILAPTAAAAQSSNFYVPEDQAVTVSVSPDLAGSETADIQISHDNGETFADYIDGTAVQLTATKNALRLYGPMFYRIDKDATAGATGLYLNRFPQ